jgi:hypothetical protein
MNLSVNGDYFPTQRLPVNLCNGEVVKFGVLFEVRTEFLNII